MIIHMRQQLSFLCLIILCLCLAGCGQLQPTPAPGQANAPDPQDATPTATEASAPPASPTPIAPNGPIKSANPNNPTEPPAPNLTPASTAESAPATPSFAFWSMRQLLLIFQAAELKIAAASPLPEDDLPRLPLAPQEAWQLDLADYCSGCRGQILLFDSPESLAAAEKALSSAPDAPPDWQFSNHNVLLRLDGKLSQRRAQAFTDALETLLPASLLQPSQDPVEAYESWAYYYPLDRGQQVDPERGLGQRTLNRWEGPQNVWQYGQASWRYQDPAGTRNPPPHFPSSYQGEPLTYYFLYHCEPGENPNPSRDCLNWRMFIEMASISHQGTEFQNWALGGWRWKKPKPVRWEIFFPPQSIGGPCQKNYVRDALDDAFLQDPARKVPLVVRLPKTPGKRFVGQAFCAVAFNGYLLRQGHIVNAYQGIVTTQNLASAPDYAGRKHIQARNDYYTLLTEVDGEAIYQRSAYEIFWMHQALPEALKDGGMQSFWWYTWAPPPEDNRDADVDPAWSAYQWCYQDLTKAPAGLGVLVCEEEK